MCIPQTEHRLLQMNPIQMNNITTLKGGGRKELAPKPLGNRVLARYCNAEDEEIIHQYCTPSKFLTGI